MYADDIILFSKATRNNADAIVKCIQKYCNWSGQSLNTSKSGVYFSKHSSHQNRRAVKHILQMKKLKKDAIYLGSPLFLSRARAKDFRHIIDKVETRLTGWRSKCLSWAGRSTLLNSVVQSIPTYAMSSFSIPNSVCNKLDSLSRRFWWKLKNSDGRFLALTAWDNLFSSFASYSYSSTSPPQQLFRNPFWKPEISYSQHCNDVIPEQPLSSGNVLISHSNDFLNFQFAFFSSNVRIFSRTTKSGIYLSPSTPHISKSPPPMAFTRAKPP
nr:putative ribonuclease h protein [Quercus suber]